MCTTVRSLALTLTLTLTLTLHPNLGSHCFDANATVAVPQHGQSAPLAGPQLGSCASSGRAWRLWAARHSQEEAEPLGAQPRPRVLERAASKAADFSAFDPSGG